ncbi:hypothetical protein WUBG_01319 [Wuchereria bancrofti]|uniref:Uncharacterized protein n=1 Tax=Wuchereria bancrofti TaxID=6293 RepID=J9EYT4_WUCBA|nr:hypothetical protein WUBG_01319 [Wuchereria bancrofti]
MGGDGTADWLFARRWNEGLIPRHTTDPLLTCTHSMQPQKWNGRSLRVIELPKEAALRRKYDQSALFYVRSFA